MKLFIYIRIHNHFLILDLLLCLCPFLNRLRAWAARPRLRADGSYVEEAIFQLKFLLQDLRGLERVADTLWESYVAGKLDLAAVSASTDMAILLAKELEAEAREPLGDVLERRDSETAKQAARNLLMQTMRISEPTTASFLRHPSASRFAWLFD